MEDTAYVPDVGAVMTECRNYFEAERLSDRVWTVTGGTVTPTGMLAAGGWYAVGGACAMSGVRQADVQGRLTGVPDGIYTASVWRLEPPQDFLRLCEAIAAWCRRHPHTAAVSERFGDYSRTLATGSHGAPLTWAQVFCTELWPWRRVMTEVDLRA